jgi:hypothetical protein
MVCSFSCFTAMFRCFLGTFGLLSCFVHFFFERLSVCVSVFSLRRVCSCVVTAGFFILLHACMNDNSGLNWDWGIIEGIA